MFAACGVLLLGGWVDAKHAVGHVNWGLLLLIGSALGFSKAMANSGLADFAGRAVRESGMSESASLYALFGLTMVSGDVVYFSEKKKCLHTRARKLIAYSCTTPARLFFCSSRRKTGLVGC